MTDAGPVDWRAEFDQNSNLICVLDAQFKIIYCNPAWDALARAQGVESATEAKLVGLPLFQFIPRALDHHYRKLLERAREKRQTVNAEYECNTPDHYRRYRMTISGLAASSGVVIMHSLVAQGPIPYPICGRTQNDYGIGDRVLMCAQCRRTKRRLDNLWDWVPDFLRQIPSGADYGVCDDCVSLYHS
ncbi:MAG TPA: PAS domain-containing protein [Terriglobales bacterium]|nr:PAS domain-containing protein [Terriglobales bacterium]